MKANSLGGTLARISAPELLDASIEEVFGTMLGWTCVRQAEAWSDGPELHSVMAVVGFGGSLSGACILRAGSYAAQKIAARLTGAEPAGLDETVQDAIGELCNMVAGTWKGRVPELASNCALSVPAVITGHDYHVHVQTAEFELCHVCAFEDVRFEVSIVCDAFKEAAQTPTAGRCERGMVARDAS